MMDFLVICIQLIGFGITIYLELKTQKYEMQKIKTEQQLSDLYGLQKEVLVLVRIIERLLSGDKDAFGEYNGLWSKIYNTVLCSGSEDAVKIAVYIDELIAHSLDDKIDLPHSRLLAPYIVLAMQLKFDVTGIETSPKAWYLGKYTSQRMLSLGSFYEDSIAAINDVVNKLKLAKFLSVEQ